MFGRPLQIQKDPVQSGPLLDNARLREGETVSQACGVVGILTEQHDTNFLEGRRAQGAKHLTPVGKNLLGCCVEQGYIGYLVTEQRRPRVM